MTNVGQLASRLRYKNYSEAEVARIIADLETREGDDAVAAAEGYPKQSRTTPFKTGMNVAYGLVLAVWAVLITLRAFDVIDALPRAWVTGLLTLGTMVVVSLVGLAYSRRAPRSRS